MRVAFMRDATNFRGRHVLISIGITEAGTKHAQAFVELTLENAAASGFLEDLMRLELRYENVLLHEMDGVKRIQKAVRQLFGYYVRV